MSLIQSLCCVNCLKLYDEERKPCRGTCSESICVPCKDGLKHKNCPICGKEDAFSGAEVNYTGLELQRVALEKLTEESLLEVFMEMKKKDNGPCGECGDYVEKLRICVKCAKEENMIQETFPGKWELDFTGFTILGAFYRAKRFSTCASCAIDKHEDHEIKYFRDVFTDRAVNVELLHSLIRLIDQKFDIKVKKSEHGSWQQVLEHCNWNAFTVEQFRQSHNRAQMLWKSMMFFGNPDVEIGSMALRRELQDACNKANQLGRRFNMAWVEYAEMMIEKHSEELKDSEDLEKFLDGMQKVKEKTLLPEEILEGEELWEIEQLVEARILEYCDDLERNVFSDQKKAIMRIHEVVRMIWEHEPKFTAAKQKLRLGDSNIQEMTEVAVEMDRLVTLYHQAEYEDLLVKIVTIKSTIMADKPEGLDASIRDYLKEFTRLKDQNHQIPEFQAGTGLKYI